MAQNRFTPERIVIAVVAVVVVASVAMLIRRGVERDRAEEAPSPSPIPTEVVLPKSLAQPRVRTTVPFPGIALYALALTPDGKQLVVAGSKLDKNFKDQPVVRVWNLEAGREEADLTRDGEVGRHMCLTVSPDGKAIAAGGVVVVEGKVHGRVSIWDAGTKHLRWSADVASQRVQCLAWTADSARLAGGEFNGAVSVWNAVDGKVQATWPAFDPPAAVNAVAWSQDGKRLAFGGDQTTRLDWTTHVWYVDEGCDSPIRVGPITDLTFAEDDRSVYHTVPGHFTVLRWDPEESDRASSYAWQKSPVGAIALASAGRLLVTSTRLSPNDTTIRGWSAGFKPWELSLATDDTRILARPFAISADGTVLAIATADRPDDTIVWSVSIYDVPPLP